MTLLLPPVRIAERRKTAKGPLAPLAESLAADLGPLVMDGFTVPREKARLSRAGGRCPHDGTLLEFDPFSPRRHRCARCGNIFDDESHYLWWVMSYQLWLAERAVHGAVLHLLRGDAAARQLSESILDTYADAYLGYPNRDNVLGPTRLFFSTYLESIWLLQICIAIDLLEAAGPQTARGARIRERIIAPSAQLIGSYDEGASNRQVWNNAALLASSALLGSYPESEATVWGRSGLVAHLAQGLLSDGTWYEGENYHLFAHRGLWYGVQMAERLELGLTEPFATPYVSRFDAGFAASFVSALPDLTLPSRRDSQYAISTRQWRFAELCELGLLRTEDARLHGMLARLYASDIPRADVGRARSTAEVERNLPPTALTRADLGWRSLLLARADLPRVEPAPPESVLLDGQGLAILRRDSGEAYVALDYGHSGGGHGHPDRLNLQLAHGTVRWLDDMGTGSYVDPTLHWYRSTLAHNAPLVDGRSQARVHGVLRAYEDDGTTGWVHADVDGIAPGVSARRSVVAMPGYLVDVLEWQAMTDVVVDLPIHLDVPPPGGWSWVHAPFPGADGLEDGARFVVDSMRAEGRAADVLRLAGSREGHAIASWISAPGDAREWWQAVAPGAPGNPRGRFYLARTRGTHGTVRSVLDWSGSVATVHFGEADVVVQCRDGSTHTHARIDAGWQVGVSGPDGVRLLRLGGNRERVASEPRTAPHEASLPTRQARHVIPFVEDDRVTGGSIPLAERKLMTLALGESHYRRSELPWREAGRPEATVRLAATRSHLHLSVRVRKQSPVVFAPPRATNELDNEDPDINSDGVQIHLADAPSDSPVLTWLLVPDPDSDAVRIRRPAGGAALTASWAPATDGYIIRCALELTAPMREHGFDLDLIVNEIPPGRERRRGQLVLSGGGDWIFLRGDRQARDRLLHFVLAERDSRP